jgi:hypothetical protein
MFRRMIAVVSPFLASSAYPLAILLLVVIHASISWPCKLDLAMNNSLQDEPT